MKAGDVRDMETWNREELYRDVWETPMSKLTEKYGVSNVMIGKVCRKLTIPVPGRGYWARKAAGQSITIKPLPQIKNLPVIQRVKLPSSNPPGPRATEPEPRDAEYLGILEVESLKISVDPSASLHRLVAATAKAFKSVPTDYKGYRNTKMQRGVFTVNLTEATIDRAMRILNTVLLALEKRGYVIKFGEDGKRAFATIFEQEIGFEILEKYSQISIPPSQRKDDFFAPKMKIEPNGILEFRAIHSRYGYSAVRDQKRKSLEDQIPTILGAILGQARTAKLRSEQARQWEIERQARQMERVKLSEQIHEEEKKLASFDALVTNWSRAHLYREFVSALEGSWRAGGEDLSDGSDRAKRLDWMRQQADRLDPFVQSPASILDRKKELNRF
jgi:hypothetical protein